MIKQKFKKILCAGLLVSTFLGTSAFAADRQPYKDYLVPRMQGNNYSGVHKKENTKNFITNKVTEITGASTVTFWAANADYEPISRDYDQKVGTQTDLEFTVTGYNKKNVQVCMGLENASWDLHQGYVAGWANFH